MLSKFHKYLKKISLSLLGGAAALALGLLLLVPEAQSGETYYECALRPQKEKPASGRKKMNHSNHSVVRKNYYNIQRRTYGPTDVMVRRERTLGELTTNTVEKVLDDGTTQRVVRITHKSKSETPSGVNRIGRKGKREKAQKEAVEKAQKDAKGFRTHSDKTNDFNALKWQAATPPTGGVHTASSPRRAGMAERKEKRPGDKDPNGSARKIKERNRERQGESSVTNITRRAQYAGSADDKADADN